MARCELESSARLDTQADEVRRTERSFVCVKRQQLDPAAVVQRRDDARRLLEHAVRQRARPVGISADMILFAAGWKSRSSSVLVIAFSLSMHQRVTRPG